MTAAPDQGAPAPAALESALALVAEIPDFPEPGVRYRDLTPVLADAAAFAVVTEALSATLPDDVDLVAGVEARGFLFAAAVAYARRRGVLVLRKPGKLPAVADEVSYRLEYGTATLQLPVGTVRAGQRVAVVDDVLATGGTLAAACGLVERAGATVAGLAVVLELADLPGRAALPGRTVHALRTV